MNSRSGVGPIDIGRVVDSEAGSNRSLEQAPCPAFGEAEPGSLLDRLDHAHADRQAEQESRAASAREDRMRRAPACEPDPYPDESATDPEPAEVAAKRAENRAVWEAAAWEHIRKQQACGAARVRRIDYDPQRGVYTGQRRRGDSGLETPRIIARSKRRLQYAGIPANSSAAQARFHRPQAHAQREHRPAPRRAARSSRAGPDGELSDGEPPQRARRGELRHISAVLADVDYGGFLSEDVREAAAHIVEAWPAGLSPAAFDVAVFPWTFGLRSDDASAAKLRIAAALPEALQRSLHNGIPIVHFSLAPSAAADLRGADRQASAGPEGGVA